MRSLSKVFFAVLILSAAAGGAWAYFYLKSSKPPESEVLGFFPAQAVFYLESSDVIELHARVGKRSLAVDALRESEPVRSFCNALQVIDSLAQADTWLKDQLAGTVVHYAGYASPANSWMMGFSLKSLGDVGQAASSLRSMFPRLRQHDDNIAEIRIGRTPVFVTVTGGIVRISNTRHLLSSGNNAAPLSASGSFLAFRELHPATELLAYYVDNARYAQAGYNWPVLPSTEKGGILSGIIDAGTSEIRANGFLTPVPGEITAGFQNVRPYPTEALLNALPAQTSFFNAVAVDSVRPAKPSGGNLEFWRIASDSAMFDIRSAFFANCTGIVCTFNAGGGAIVITDVRDSLSAEEYLQKMSDSVMNVGVGCYRLYAGTELFAEAEDVKSAYALLHGGRLYCFERLRDVQAFVFSLGNQGRETNSGFRKYCAEQLPVYFNVAYYCSPRRMPGLAGKALGLNRENTRFSHFVFSAVATDKVRTRTHIQYSKEDSSPDEPDILWTTIFDTTISRQPELFRNHTTGERELVVQDDGNSMYLVSAKGEKIWKRSIGGRINSPVFMIDAFKNGKLQMLFSTQDEIHLVDRNGNNVEGFPVKLPVRATAGINVFDYENKRDYRILVPCGDRRIYNYSADGKRVKDFLSPVTGDRVRLPVKYANIGGSEFIVAVDSGGRIYTFSRRGQPKGSLTNRAIAGCSEFYIDAAANTAQSHIVYVDVAEGLLNRISFQDKKEIISLGDGTRGMAYRFDRADNNRFTDVIIMGKKVSAFDLAGNKVIDRGLNVNASHGSVHHTARGMVIVAYGEAEKRLEVSSAGSALYSASSPAFVADLFRNGRQYMVFADGHKLHCIGW